jgi:hypothetical protein
MLSIDRLIDIPEINLHNTKSYMDMGLTLFYYKLLRIYSCILFGGLEEIIREYW